MALIYPLTEVLPACTEREINKAFFDLDDLQDAIETEITLSDFYNMFAEFSGGESKIIFNSWKQGSPIAARTSTDLRD